MAAKRDESESDFADGREIRDRDRKSRPATTPPKILRQLRDSIVPWDKFLKVISNRAHISRRLTFKTTLRTV